MPHRCNILQYLDQNNRRVGVQLKLTWLFLHPEASLFSSGDQAIQSTQCLWPVLLRNEMAEVKNVEDEGSEKLSKKSDLISPNSFILFTKMFYKLMGSSLSSKSNLHCLWSTNEFPGNNMFWLQFPHLMKAMKIWQSTFSLIFFLIIISTINCTWAKVEDRSWQKWLFQSYFKVF